MKRRIHLERRRGQQLHQLVMLWSSVTPPIVSMLSSVPISISSPAVFSAAGAFPVTTAFLPIYYIPVSSPSSGTNFPAPVSLPSLVSSSAISLPTHTLTLGPLDFPTHCAVPDLAGLSLSAPSIPPPRSLVASFASDLERGAADELLLHSLELRFSQRSPVRSPLPAFVSGLQGMEGRQGALFLEPHGRSGLSDPSSGPARAPDLSPPSFVPAAILDPGTSCLRLGVVAAMSGVCAVPVAEGSGPVEVRGAPRAGRGSRGSLTRTVRGGH
ncbi:uncharacterized protein LOC128665698 [Bombina bombina]|uniref:uncharacterized protein LOC128665698 n=1 Tax=Bombina bombina TaxID=8345 RepID=UPI00235A6332|nr:uncharacterized protein LOC128665698 [Bombina bombina]